MATKSWGREKTTEARTLPSFLADRARAVGADFHLLFGVAERRNVGRILACNWIYDTVAELGPAAIAGLAECGAATPPGRPPRSFHPRALAALSGHDEIAILADQGHHEVFVMKVPVGRRRFYLVLSAGRAGAVERQLLTRLQMACSYALSGLAAGRAAREETLLSDRERECLSWVSEGKTTEEVAVILGVSTNTVNSQIAHAIHKLRAKNRAMAVAMATRRNLI